MNYKIGKKKKIGKQRLSIKSVKEQIKIEKY